MCQANGLADHARADTCIAAEMQRKLLGHQQRGGENDRSPNKSDASRPSAILQFSKQYQEFDRLLLAPRAFSGFASRERCYGSGPSRVGVQPSTRGIH